MLTEATVEKMFRSLMNDPARNEEIFDKAEELLEEELRPESPLRHRLTVELEELREIATPESNSRACMTNKKAAVESIDSATAFFESVLELVPNDST